MALLVSPFYAGYPQLLTYTVMMGNDGKFTDGSSIHQVFLI